MKLIDYTTENGFLPHLKCSSLADAVSQLATGLVQAGAVPSAETLVAEVMRRESEGSTSVGNGLVIPHARLAGLTDVFLSVATLAEPLAAGGAEGTSVDIVILLVGPVKDTRLMLRVLARLARLVREGAFLEGLRGAATPEGLQSAFARTAD
jgi:PTS system nitrogen regulatory IIA component